MTALGDVQRRITHFSEGIGISLEQLTPIARHRGPFGQIRLFHHTELGKVFVLNGEIQHVEAWAPLYHEPLIHLPGSFIPEIRDVLILGGGTLYAAYEALKYKSVRRVVLCDHNPLVTEVVAKHYSHARACLSDTRLTIVHEDAYSSVLDTKSRFDLIINDGADLLSLNSPAQARDTKTIFSSMARALKPRGVCADVVFRHLFERHRVARTIKQIRSNGKLALSLIFLPEYHGVLHVLCIWGKHNSALGQTCRVPQNKEHLKWARNSKSSPCVYFNPRFLPYYLYLPRYFKMALTTKRTIA